MAAQRFLDAHPNANLVILEKYGDIMGFSDCRRMHDGFWTQCTHGLSEFSDLPMTRPHKADAVTVFYRAKYTTGYREEYCTWQDERGRCLCDCMVFNANLDSVRKVNNAWNVRVEAAVFATTKLMVANGLLPGKEIFGGAIVHTEGFGDSKMMENSEIKRLVVILAGKSAANVVYMGAKSGKVVHWVNRANGREHAFFASGRGKGPSENAAHTRIVASIGQSIFDSENGWTNFLQQSWVGRWLVRKLPSNQDRNVREEANYHGLNTPKSFDRLEYETAFFWQNSPGDLLHHDDFWDTVALDVHVHHDQVKSLDGNLVRLEGSQEIECDTIVCDTGWVPSLQ
ncbi:hypothetical protein HBH98_075890 [Parastagonospora nodorum]|nr:hypothetical protein HBH53_168380 [Parastagonospora nodorum]KAH4051592.1 hypothetical protein HBH49_119900 [Parastagonospora nodorum]KAH4081927.1 hypothetical protein HBH46_223070 [Parastagonospora nodorum]KAH4140482.1 hypothetical protein HBH45_080340 [Parastagonospora nodorum]KAH4253902.1 hypothetical protein HBI03_191160 [Parastagonospora nodorum]